MIVDINKIIVKSDRIRKEFGNLQELADDIKQNGLINPPVVNKNYELLAGERRLEACKSLGWSQIEIRMMDTRNAYHELNVEISENESRKEFSKSERVDYMKRLLRIEQAKAKERQESGKKNLSDNSHEGRSDEATASQFGISSNTMRKEISIVDNKDLLTPEDFADWDEGKLSTNKAYQKIKAELAAKNQRISELESLATKIKDAGDVAREESRGLAAEYEEKIRGYEAEISRLKKSQYSPEGQEINAAYEFWVASERFVNEVLATIRYNDVVINTKDSRAGEWILKACRMLTDATTDIIKRFSTEEAIIIDMED